MESPEGGCWGVPGGVTGVGGRQGRGDIQDGEDLAGDGERTEEVVRPTAACGPGRGADGTPFAGRAEVCLARLPDGAPGGRAAPASQTPPRARARGVRLSFTPPGPAPRPGRVPFFSDPLPASRCSISFASATELPFQPAPLLRAPPTTGGPPPTHLPPANEAFKANYLGFLIRHRRHALKEVRPGDFGLFLVAAVCRLWQRLPQRHSARRRLPMPEQEGNLQLGG